MGLATPKAAAGEEGRKRVRDAGVGSQINVYGDVCATGATTGEARRSKTHDAGGSTERE